MKIISVDPGKRVCGAALSVDGRVTHAETFTAHTSSKDPLQLGMDLAHQIRIDFGLADLTIIERPIHRVRGGGNVRMQDIIDLATVAGCFAWIAPRLMSVTPKEWKGDLPKEKHHARVHNWLCEEASDEESNLWESLKKKSDHNARDAFALNLFATGRLKRGGEA